MYKRQELNYTLRSLNPGAYYEFIYKWVSSDTVKYSDSDYGGVAQGTITTGEPLAASKTFYALSAEQPTKPTPLPTHWTNPPSPWSETRGTVTRTLSLYSIELVRTRPDALTAWTYTYCDVTLVQVV